MLCAFRRSFVSVLYLHKSPEVLCVLLMEQTRADSVLDEPDLVAAVPELERCVVTNPVQERKRGKEELISKESKQSRWMIPK